ncbi:TetR/AcrR family transcriptional regulator [Brevirhabdus sp.]|uniref:TetR/AcrR family transcriptional regulator n=1 Tax=Brevirhabdus sp. TaxID=2004514 RepID=UPI004059295D
MSGLRERQKADRRSRILEAARAAFGESGYEKSTIEAIAETAGVSGVTVHNYYGTKSGILLALVTESDRRLLDLIADEFAEYDGGLHALVLRFAAVIRAHALSHLTRALWRQVIAASVIEADSPFGKAYHALDQQLALALGHQIERLQDRGALAREVSAFDMGKALFHLQNTRFIQFVSVSELTNEDVESKLNADLEALLSPRI